MIIKSICKDSEFWQRTIAYALECSWKAGSSLASLMKDNKFNEWERVFVVFDKDKIIGFATLTKKDSIPDIDYYPFIGYLFVDKKYRGKRISKRIISHIIKYAKDIGFDKVYLISDHVNLYEKYGFSTIDERLDLWGNKQKIYMHLT